MGCSVMDCFETCVDLPSPPVAISDGLERSLSGSSDVRLSSCRTKCFSEVSKIDGFHFSVSPSELCTRVEGVHLRHHRF